MKRSTQCTFVCLLVFCLLHIGCGSEPVKPPKTKKTLVFITNTASDFWKIAQKGVEKADAELPDAEALVKMPFGGTAKEQEKYINDSLNKDDADAIAISPIDPKEQEALINKTAKKVLVITQDSDAPNSDRVLYLGADNRAAGKQAGELLTKALPNGGKVMAFAGKKLQNAMDRLGGLRESVTGTKIEVLDLMTDDTDHMKAKDNALETINKYPDIAAMVGLWSYNGPAILQAVRNSNKVGKIKIVCFDDETDTLEGIKDGSIFGSVVQQPFEYGYQAVTLMAKILKGDKSVIPATKTVLIPTIVVQRNNLDEYKTKLNEHLGGK
jgi:ribose transport system substrate-binding protein